MSRSPSPHFGVRLRSARLAAGLGLRSFATLLELRPSDVTAVEWGERKPWREPRVRTAVERLVGSALDWSTDGADPSVPPLSTAAQLACWRPTPRGADADPPAVNELAAAFGAARSQRSEHDVETLFRHLAIRLAEQFAAPLDLMVRRLRSWPCRLPARLHAAAASGADELPAAHEWPTAGGRRQLRLFDSA